MKTMKNFLIFLLLFLAVFFSTDLIAKFVLESNYKEINKYEITTTLPQISIEEAKAGSMNGIIKGKVTNNTENLMKDVFVKIELKSENNNTLGTEYIKMGDFQPGENKEFSANCKYSGINSFLVSVTDHAESVPSIEDEPIYKTAKQFYPVIRLVVWAVTPAVYFVPLFLFSIK